MEWLRSESVRIALNVINGVKTSTVLLYKMNSDDPDIYETCVFEGDDSNVIGIYQTEAAAIAGHNRIIKEQLMRL